MQPNVRSSRFSTDMRPDELNRLKTLFEVAIRERPEIVIWPESTVDHAVNDPLSRRTFSEMARRASAHVIVGTGFMDEAGGIHNSAALFSPAGELAGRYDKHWLVPMGEWVPLRRWLPFGNVFGFPERDTVAGGSDSLLEAGPARISVLICYESVFPILSRTRVAAGATLLVSITNDSWAGESAELQQHHAMTILRAVETRRFMASAATTGITALIDPVGRVERVRPYREDSLVGNARLCGGITPYVRWGDWFVFVCAIVVIWTFIKTPGKNT